MFQRMIIKSMSGNERQLDELSPNGIQPDCAMPVTGDDRVAAAFPDREYNQETIWGNYGPIDSDKPLLPIILKVAGGIQAVLQLPAWRTP